MSYYIDISFLSYRVNHSGFREMTVLCLKYISSSPWLDSHGWWETQNRVESSSGTYVQFSIEKTGQVIASLFWNQTDVSVALLVDKLILPLPIYNLLDAKTWHDKLIKVTLFNSTYIICTPRVSIHIDQWKCVLWGRHLGSCRNPIHTRRLIYYWRYAISKMRDCILVFFYILGAKHIGSTAGAQIDICLNKKHKNYNANCKKKIQYVRDKQVLRSYKVCQ